MTLKEFVAVRDLRIDAVAVLARVDKGTVSRIINGKSSPRPETVVRLARGLGVSARRMQAMVDASRDAARAA